MLARLELIPTLATTGLRAKICCQPRRRRSYARTSPTWRTGCGADRKARFEQDRRAARQAAPFLSRMKFVDKQGEGASPTLAALRVSNRE